MTRFRRTIKLGTAGIVVVAKGGSVSGTKLYAKEVSALHSLLLLLPHLNPETSRGHTSAVLAWVLPGSASGQLFKVFKKEK